VWARKRFADRLQRRIEVTLNQLGLKAHEGKSVSLKVGLPLLVSTRMLVMN
jgi:hypothetical protein